MASAAPTRAILLAAGCGRRLSASLEPDPKCLLSFDGVTLLERHLEILAAGGVAQIEIVVGYQHSKILERLERSPHRERVNVHVNRRFEQGSVLSLAEALPALVANEDVLLMDADVLYDPNVLTPLLASPGSGLLIDRDCTAADLEAVKVCFRDGRIVEFAKQPDPRISFECMGESVGFFRFDAETARRLAFNLEVQLALGANQEAYEMPLRQTILEDSKAFRAFDVTHLEWIEIDFPSDLRRAREDVWPRLMGTAPAERT